MSDFHPIPAGMAEQYEVADDYIEVVREYVLKCKLCDFTPPHFGCIPALEQHLREKHGYQGKELWITARMHHYFVREIIALRRELAEVKAALAKLEDQRHTSKS